MSATTSVVIMSGLMMLHKIRSAEMHTKRGEIGDVKKGRFWGTWEKGKKGRKFGSGTGTKFGVKKFYGRGTWCVGVERT